MPLEDIFGSTNIRKKTFTLRKKKNELEQILFYNTIQMRKKIRDAELKEEGSSNDFKDFARDIPSSPLVQHKADINFLLSQPLENEIELSFGHFVKNEKAGPNALRFIPSVSPGSFHSLLHFFGEGPYKGEVNVTKISFLSHTRVFLKSPYRKIETINNGRVVKEEYEKKIRDHNTAIRDPQWGFSIYSSVEQPTRPQPFQQTPRREKWTWSAASPAFQIFASTVRFFPESGDPVTFYEVEIERKKKPTGAPTFSEFEKVWRVTSKALNGGYSDIPSVDQRSEVSSFLSQLLKTRSYGGIDMPTKWWDKPIDLRPENLLGPYSFAVTIKFDGLRKFLLFHNSGIYLIFPRNDLVRISAKVPRGMVGTLMDGEWLGLEGEHPKVNTFYAFDLLFDAGKDMRKAPFDARYKALKSRVDQLSLPFVKAKEYISGRGLYPTLAEGVRVWEATTNNPDLAKLSDGLILQSLGPYADARRRTFKWKPSDKMTIDFFLSPDPQKEGYANPFVAGKGKGFVPFSPEGVVFSIPVSDPKLYEKVVECSWVKKGDGDYNGEWKVYRIRHDKSPNFLEHAVRMWETILKPVRKDTLLGRDLVVTRKFHNQEKKNLLEKYLGSGDSLLDIGSGRGGDVGKWKKLRLGEVFTVEPSEENAKELERRANDVSLEIHIVKGEFQNLTTELPKDVDVVTSFFSLTFFYSEEKKLDAFLNNVERSLKAGGYFIGITMDGKKVSDLFADQGTCVISNPAFSIACVSLGEDKNPFGRTITITLNDPDSMVKNQIEWLTDLDYLERSLTERGFEKMLISDLDPSKVVLPNYGYLFNSLMTLFVFKKKGTATSKPVVPKPSSLTLKAPISDIKEWGAEEEESEEKGKEKRRKLFPFRIASGADEFEKAEREERELEGRESLNSKEGREKPVQERPEPLRREVPAEQVLQVVATAPSEPSEEVSAPINTNAVLSLVPFGKSEQYPYSNINFLGNVSSPSASIGCVLMTFSKSFRNIKAGALEIFYKKFRYLLSKTLTRENFIEHHGEENYSERAWAQTKLKIIDENQNFTQDLFWVLEDKLKMKIVVLSPDLTRIVYPEAVPNYGKKRVVSMVCLGEGSCYDIFLEKDRYTVRYDHLTKALEERK